MIEEELLTEENRFEALNKAKEAFGESEGELMARFLNPIGQHEAQDRAFIAHEHVETYLVNHPFIIMNKESWRLAMIANQCLAELYQRIANVNIE